MTPMMKEWLTPLGQAFMLLLKIITDDGRQFVKDFCMERISDPALGADYKRLLDAINDYERGIAIIRRRKPGEKKP